MLLVTARSESAELVIPGVANAPGANGTFFVSDLTVTNLSSNGATASITYIEAGGASLSNILFFPPGTVAVTNAVETLFGKTNSGGALVVHAPASILVQARTYNRAGGGTFGLALPHFRRSEVMRPGETAHLPWISQSGVSTAGHRTNVSITFPDATGGSAELEIVDSAGVVVARKLYSAPSAAFFQESVGNLVANLEVGRAIVHVRSGTAVAYASVVDNVTGDASVFGGRRVVAAATDAVLAGVARLDGLNGTFFKTDGRLVNAGAGPAQVTVAFLPAGSDNTVPRQTATFTLGAGATRHFDDLLFELFSLPVGSSGGVRIQSDAPVIAVSRTSNVDRSGARPGAFGAQQTARPFASFTVAGEVVHLGALRHDSAFRTNLGFSSGPAGAVFDLTLRDARGTRLADSRQSLPPRGWTQLSAAALFEVAAFTDAIVEIRPVSGSVDAYSSVVDQLSGDATISYASPRSSPCEETGIEITSAACVGVVATARATFGIAGATYQWTAAGATIVGSAGTRELSFIPSSPDFSLSVAIPSGNCVLAASTAARATARAEAKDLVVPPSSVGVVTTIRWTLGGSAERVTLSGTDFPAAVTLPAEASSYSYTPTVAGTKQVTISVTSACGTTATSASYVVSDAAGQYGPGSGGSGGGYPGYFTFNAASGRAYNVYVPSKYDPAQPARMVIALGGQGQRADNVIQNGWQQIAERDNVIVVTLTPSSSGPGYSGAYDVPEFLAIEEAEREVPKRYNVAIKHVYYWGFSAGAHVTYMFVLEAGRSNRVAAFAVQAGAIEAAATRTNPPVWPPQAGARRLPAFLSAGTSDTTGTSGGLIAAMRRNRDMLLAEGYPVVTREVAGQGHTYTANDVAEAWKTLATHRTP